MSRADISNACDDSHALAMFLHNVSQTLVTLNLFECELQDEAMLSSISLPNLKNLRLVESFHRGAAAALINAATDLRRVDINCVNFGNKACAALVAKHKSLEVLQLEDMEDLTTDVLDSVLQHLTMLQVVTLRSLKAAALNDNNLLTLALCCPLLTSVALYNCDGVTNAGLASIGRHAGQHLLHLAVERCDKATLQGVLQLVLACPQLKDLSLAHTDRSQPGDAPLAPVLDACPHLEALSLVDMPVDVAALQALASHCQQLQFLCLVGTIKSDVATALAQLLCTATNLVDLCVSQHDNQFSHVACAVLRMLRPGLRITRGREKTPFWRGYAPPDHPDAEYSDSDYTYYSEDDDQDGGDGEEGDDDVGPDDDEDGDY
jgi:hypothetical protein